MTTTYRISAGSLDSILAARGETNHSTLAGALAALRAVCSRELQYGDVDGADEDGCPMTETWVHDADHDIGETTEPVAIIRRMRA